MQTTLAQLKRNAKESLKGKWLMAVAVTMTVLSLSLLDVIFQHILMSVFRVDAVWSMLEPTTLPHYSRIAGFGITVFSAVYGLFLFVPFLMGVLRWFWENSNGKEPELNTVFYYFSSSKIFFKTVLLAFLLFLFAILGALLCFLPYVLMDLLTKPQFFLLFGCAMPVWVSGLFPLIQFFEIAGMVLFLCWIARYMLFFVPLFENEQLSAVKIVSESVKLTKGRLLRLVGFALSFVGWFLLCIFLLPAIFVIPYALASLVEYAKEEQRIAEESKLQYGFIPNGI